MAFTFRPAVREGVGLLIGLSGGTGSGKTFSAFRLAKGIAGDNPFAVIDTESGRAKHYADQFRFDHGDLGSPFSPDHYADAIIAADEAKYPVVIVDSASHEWAGEGGVLDMQEGEFSRMGGRDSAKMASWIKPKMAHKAMVSRLLQVRAHVILCFRAEPKIEMTKVNGKTEVREKQSLVGLHGWIPICEKNLPFEMTCSFLLMADRPGVPQPIKLQEQHRAIFPLDRPISEDCGRRLSEWASGGVRPVSVAPTVQPESNQLMETSEREALLARIKQAGTMLNLSALARKATWATHCGNTTPASATMAQLAALCDALEAEVMATATPSAEEVFR